jgi:hypothetical protein
LGLCLQLVIGFGLRFRLGLELDFRARVEGKVRNRVGVDFECGEKLRNSSSTKSQRLEVGG